MFAEESWFRRWLGLRGSPMDALVGMVGRRITFATRVEDER